MSEYDIAFFAADIQIRDDRVIEGIAAPIYDGYKGSQYAIKPDLFERFMPGSWDRCCQEKPDIAICFQHDMERRIASTPKTAKYWADEKGLHVSLTANRTSWADDALACVRSGEVKGFSVRFIPTKSTIVKENNYYIHQVTEAMLSGEISLVYSPAFKNATFTAVRELEKFTQLEKTLIAEKNIQEMIDIFNQSKR